jgi:hypothetical protein
MLKVKTADILAAMHSIACFSDQKAKEDQTERYVTVVPGLTTRLTVFNPLASMMTVLRADEMTEQLPNMAIEAHKFHDTLRTLSSNTVEVGMNKGGGGPSSLALSARVSGLPRRFSFPNTSIDVPPMGRPTRGGFCINAEVLKTALHKALQCVAKTPSAENIAMADVILDFKLNSEGQPDTLYVIGASVSAAIFTRVDVAQQIGLDDKAIADKMFVLDNKVARAIEKSATVMPEGTMVTITRSAKKGFLTVAIGSTCLLEIAPKDVPLPPFDFVLDMEQPYMLYVDRDELLTALQQVCIQVGSKNYKSLWEATPQALKLSIDQYGDQLAYVEIQAEFNGESMTTAFLPVSVQLGMKIIRAERIPIAIGPGRIIAKIVDGDSTLYMMPSPTD